MKKSVHRKVSPLERIFTLLHDMDKPFSNQIVLEGTGSFDKSLWEKAVAAACEANPGSRLVYSERLAWSKWLDSGVPAPVREFDGANWDGRSPQGASFLSDTLPFKSEHSCEVVLVNSNPLRVVFRTLHATMDGRGSLVWIEDIFRALRGEPLIGSASTVNDTEFVSKMGNTKKWERKKKNCLAPTGQREGSEPGTTWKRVSLKGRYSKLLSQAILAISKYTRKQGPSHVCFNIPVDLRPWVNDIRTTVNLTRRIIVNISPDDSVTDINTQIFEKRDQIKVEPGYLNILGYLPLFLFRFAFTRIRQKNLKKGIYYSTGSISNLGRLEMDLFQGGGFKADTGFFIPPGTEGKPMFMTLTGGREAIEVVVSMPNTLASNGRLDRFLDAVTSELRPVE